MWLHRKPGGSDDAIEHGRLIVAVFHLPTLSRCLLQYRHTFVIGCCGIYKQQVFTNTPGEELSVLRDQADAFAQTVQIDIVNGETVITNVARLRTIETDQ